MCLKTALLVFLDIKNVFYWCSPSLHSYRQIVNHQTVIACWVLFKNMTKESKLKTVSSKIYLIQIYVLGLLTFFGHWSKFLPLLKLYTYINWKKMWNKILKQCVDPCTMFTVIISHSQTSVNEKECLLKII